eukprot:TRINITY_DN84431_c0_g1_i1.p1 TRINITY_DN84431_c0_g1~~TRINITY_DN84431_c0_g1_i1.p1  ORF type:complete len:535 (+),score=253.10 TRINITY_DN84431_c0_g1_i1:157-1605(+)
MYDLPPVEEVTLTEFEEFALDRLAVLRDIELARAKGARGDALDAEIHRSVRKNGLNDARKDLISHFLLRLAYSKTEDLRRWFLSHECQLFKWRFTKATEEHRQRFFAAGGLHYEPLRSRDMDATLRAKLLQTQRSTHNSVKDEYVGAHYRVPFEEALDLLSRRRVFLQRGFVYVPQEDLVMLVIAKYRAHLSHELVSTYRAMQSMNQDNRVRGLVSALSKRYVGPSFKPMANSGEVTRDQIPALAERSFPLCMQHLQESLHRDSHLKYGGRMQYGLFLKGIGLSLQEALEFWRQEFARKIPGDKFNKQYAYNIRHNYGKEGKRVDYTPYSCSKIINSSPGAGEHHGCPFRHFDAQHLRAKLLSRRIPASRIEDLIRLVEGKHYQLACQQYFIITHPGSKGDSVGNHPNKYFEESVNHHSRLNKDNNKKTVKADTTSSSTSVKAETSSAGSDSAADPATASPTAAAASSPAKDQPVKMETDSP